MMRLRQPQGFPAVARFCDHLDTLQALQQRADAGANERVIFGQQDANGLHDGGACGVVVSADGTDGSGTMAVIIVPLWRSDVTWTSPPTSLARSHMPVNPILVPPPIGLCTVLTSNPIPSS